MTIIHFNTLPTPLQEVENNDPNSLTKEGLIFYSTLENSPHVDSRKVSHDFSPDKIYRLVANTNKHFDISEVGIPVLTEHKKDVNNVVGFIESPVEARIIDEVYTKGNPKLKHLLGRVGVFVKDVVIKTPEIIDRMRRGLAKTVSAGIDLDSFSIKELSLVALPAIPNATLFSYHGNKSIPNMKKVKNKNLFSKRVSSENESNYALSIEEAINSAQTIEEQREEALKLFNAFLEVIEDANEIEEEEMSSMGIQDPSEIIQSAINDLSGRLSEMFLSAPEPVTPQPQTPPAQQRPGIPPKTRTYGFSPELITFGMRTLTNQGNNTFSAIPTATSTAITTIAKKVRNPGQFGKVVSAIAKNPGKAGLALGGAAVAGGLANKMLNKKKPKTLGDKIRYYLK